MLKMSTPDNLHSFQKAGARAGIVTDAHITVRGLSKKFGEIVVYDNFDVDFSRGEFVSIFGPNGCGKSTLINMIAGLIPVDAGQIRFDGKTLRETKIGYVFQNYREALFPWLTCYDNIGYPLKHMGVRKRSGTSASQRSSPRWA